MAYSVMFAAVLLALLQAVDAYTTWHVLRLGGRETNGLVRWLMERIGVGPALVIAKGLGVLIAVVLARAEVWPINLVALALLCALYVWVAVNNFAALKRQRAIAAARVEGGNHGT